MTIVCWNNNAERIEVTVLVETWLNQSGCFWLPLLRRESGVSILIRKRSFFLSRTGIDNTISTESWVPTVNFQDTEKAKTWKSEFGSPQESRKHLNPRIFYQSNPQKAEPLSCQIPSRFDLSEYGFAHVDFGFFLIARFWFSRPELLGSPRNLKSMAF